MSAKTITVKSALGNNDVALWEKHPKHPAPDHEIFVAGDVEVEAGETPRVMKALGDNILVRVDKAAKKEADKK